MRILFMGTPDIAAKCLKALIDKNMDIIGVVSGSDKPRGRGHKLTPCEVKAAATECGIPVYTPESLKDGRFLEVLEELKPELIAVVAYGRILPKYVLDYPKYGCVNMHASLLPKLRGAAPVQWAVINGDKKTGVTTMLMDEGLDTGDMLITKELEIGEYETAEELFERVGDLGSEVLAETIENIENITPVPQNHELFTYAPMLTKEMAHIDWSKDTNTVSKLICGMNSWPMAYSLYNGEVMKVISAKKGGKVSGTPGEITGYEKGKGLCVATRDGSIFIEELQFPGTKRMKTDEYLKGHRIDIGTVLM